MQLINLNKVVKRRPLKHVKENIGKGLYVQATWRNNSEDSHIQTHRRRNLKFLQSE